MSLRRTRVSRRFAVLAVAAGATAATAVPTLGTGASASTLGGLVKQANSYRHGAVPILGASLPVIGSLNNLSYGGGTNGVGVTTGAPRVYLVFWGSQWGAQGTNASGYTTLSGDPNKTAPLLQAFFKGLGSSTDSWSKVMTQYCEGVPAGSQTCPSTAPHVGYPAGGALAGVWADESAAAPSQATQTQLGQEAVAAAKHFGNTATGSNRNTQYVILSPTGTHPDGFNTATSTWCAWHDWTGDVSVNDPSGGVAFTNMPYVIDAGSSCGTNFVNSGSNGITDGVTIVEGHEYAETITDQFPSGGWTDFTGNENGDKCAWINPGQQGGAQNITLSTGSFAVQSTWANDYSGGAGGCEVSHP